jgi:hypothetical protein
MIQPLVSNNYDAGYHYNYETGIQKAKLGEPFIKVSTGSGVGPPVLAEPLSLQFLKCILS